MTLNHVVNNARCGPGLTDGMQVGPSTLCESGSDDERTGCLL